MAVTHVFVYSYAHAPLDSPPLMCISMAKNPHAHLEFNSRKLLKNVGERRLGSQAHKR